MPRNIRNNIKTMETSKRTFNRDLFDNAQDFKIAQLEQCISRFKAYDKKRKAYIEILTNTITNLREELRQTKSQTMVEPKEPLPVSKKDQVILSLRSDNKKLRLLLRHHQLTVDGLTDADFEKMREDCRLHGWQQQMPTLHQKIRDLKEANDRLISQFEQKGKEQ